MGLRDKYAKKIEEQGFRPLELSEENVQAIFNRCLAREDTNHHLYSDIFPTLLGYIGGRIFKFDRNMILQDKRKINYLFGQLAAVHNGKSLLTIDDSLSQYTGVIWTSNKVVLMNLLYLGGCDEINCIIPFSKKNNDSATISRSIKPTLSPKDPNFPAWWETHRAEWET